MVGPVGRPVVLVISGPPGSGKSATARLVAQRFDRAVCLDSDWFWTTIVTGFVPPWRPEADPQNRAMLRAVAESSAALATSGYAVVVDGVVGPSFLGIFTESLMRHGVELHYVVLRPDLATTLARVTARAGCEQRGGHLAAAFADEDPAADMWVQFSDLDQLERNVIDNSRLDASATAALVWSRYLDGTVRS